ncbi:hypothetical protein KXD40_007923 [Peronospora effusa]|uniref:Uncharacterized protein n=1 Tax=Peronospora effusa TaxID=542832 RepID=A0A3M6VGY7_9STRA|nr:hypothetical protein DD238_007214 [Peronospora effusa]RQM16184.1 hypothetical protein DD237_007445 [Peronospora effusa]UIZ23528.1 hypothetical protein KXD40_007923 [Peronospora effusa]CAI5714011.1 unnamed protein product [Peronospora effusa]
MRANDILSMVLVTKLLLNSGASSTPTNYLLSNPHSLIDDDKNDEIQALRVGDESDIQEERGLTLTFDSVLNFLPWIAAHEAAQAAKFEQHVLAEMSISTKKVDEWLNLLHKGRLLTETVPGVAFIKH